MWFFLCYFCFYQFVAVVIFITVTESWYCNRIKYIDFARESIAIATKKENWFCIYFLLFILLIPFVHSLLNIQSLMRDLVLNEIGKFEFCLGIEDANCLQLFTYVYRIRI